MNGILNGQVDLDVAMTDDFVAVVATPCPSARQAATRRRLRAAGAVEPGWEHHRGPGFPIDYDGRYNFANTYDGNLVVHHGGQALWSMRPGSNGTDDTATIMQGGRQLILYGAPPGRSTGKHRQQRRGAAR